MSKKVAVVLTGSGYLDGSEIREAVGTLLYLSENGAEVKIFAPNEDQLDVMNTLKAEPMSEKRNQLIEAARIARGKVQPLTDLNPKDFDAIILPGGFGVAKNLCTFAMKGSGADVNKTIQEKLEGFHSSGKPIGAICIAPALIALTFPKKGMELTVGAAGEASQEIEKLGHKHVVTAPNEHHVDAKNKVVTTAAYMFDDAPVHEIFKGISKLVTDVLKMA